MHAASLLEVLALPGCDILADMAPEDAQEVGRGFLRIGLPVCCGSLGGAAQVCCPMTNGARCLRRPRPTKHTHTHTHNHLFAAQARSLMHDMIMATDMGRHKAISVELGALIKVRHPPPHTHNTCIAASKPRLEG